MSNKVLAQIRTRWLENYIERVDGLDRKERVVSTLVSDLGLTYFQTSQCNPSLFVQHFMEWACACAVQIKDGVLGGNLSSRELSFELVELLTAVNDMLFLKQLPGMTEVPSLLVYAAPEGEIGDTVAEELIDFWKDTDKTAQLYGWGENDEGNSTRRRRRSGT